MFNPLYLFTKDVLEATIKRGCTYFVRNSYPNAFNPLETSIKGNYLITPYDDFSKAQAHFNSISTDKARFFYNLDDKEQKEKLENAASQPEGYKIYSPYFYPNYKDKITPRLKEKINNYMYQHTRWKPGKGDVIFIDFFLQFGTLYISMSFAGSTIKIMFAEIEKQL